MGATIKVADVRELRLDAAKHFGQPTEALLGLPDADIEDRTG